MYRYTLRPYEGPVTRTYLSPDAVTSRANSDLCLVALVMGDTSRPAAERMADITRIAEAFRVSVAGSTHDPLREA